MSSNVTIKDVARESGVSIATVSRVVNGTGYVSESTRKKVEDAVARLGYSPNHFARSLSKGSTKIVGAVIPDISNPFFPAIARGIDDVLVSNGYLLVICNTDNDEGQEEAVVKALLEKRVDGLVFVTGSRDPRELVQHVPADVPIATIDREVMGLDCDMVTCDSYKGGYEMTRHLIDSGHRKIAFISGPDHLSTSQKRLAGFRAALSDAGMDNSGPVFYGDYRYETGYSIARDILASPQGVTAVFAANDLMALGVMRCFLDAGVLIPAQMAVAGYDDIQIASMIRPSLTTVAQPAYRMGAVAAEVLLERLNSGPGHPRKVHVLDPTLIVRDSTGGR